MDLTTNERIAAYAGLAELLSAIRPTPDFGPMGAIVVAAGDLAAASRALLDHTDHMTERLRAAHGVGVELEVLAERCDGPHYCREILLRRQDTQAAIEFGIVRVREQYLAPAVMDEIRRRERPLGEILITHDVLRRVEPRWFFRFDAASIPARALGAASADGRLGVIFCAGHPAIDVLEVIPRRSEPEHDARPAAQ